MAGSDKISRYIGERQSWTSLSLVYISLLTFGNYLLFSWQFELQYFGFLGLSVFLFISFIFISKTERDNISIYKTDFAWLFLISWMFLSYTWATDPSKVLFNAFAWSLLYVFLIFVRSIKTGKNFERTTSVILAGIFFAILVYACSYVLTYTHFKQRNSLAIHLTILFPFVLFYQSKIYWINWLKVPISILLIVVLFYLNCRGAVLGLGAIFLLFLINRQRILSGKHLLIFAGALVGIFLCFLLIPGVVDYLSQFKIFSEFSESNELDRLYMLRNSFRLLLSDPLTGVGLGNWQIEGYRDGLDDFSYIQNIWNFRTQNIHGFYGEILGELGLPGFVAFCIAFVSPAILAIKKFHKLSNFQKASTGALLFYVICLALFSPATFHHGAHKPILIIALFSLAQVIKIQDKRIFLWPQAYNRFIPLIITASSIIYLSYYQYSESKFKNLYIQKLSPEEFVEKGERAYHHTLKTNYRQHSIPFILANYSALTDNDERTVKYYNQAIGFNPNDVNILLRYARFQFEKLNNYDRAESLALHALAIHKDLIDTRLLLAQICVKKENLSQARRYLLPTRKYLLNRISKELQNNSNQTSSLPQNIPQKLKTSLDLLEEIEEKLRSANLQLPMSDRERNE